jgi:DivIVA domain-containing protein
LEVLAAALLLFLVAAAATGRLSGLAEAPVDRADGSLAPGRIGPDDVNQVSFTMAFRGYRMEEVDTALDRIVQELSARDVELATRDEQISRLLSEIDTLRTTGGKGAASAPIAPVSAYGVQPVAAPESDSN